MIEDHRSKKLHVPEIQGKIVEIRKILEKRTNNRYLMTTLWSSSLNKELSRLIYGLFLLLVLSKGKC